MPKTITVAELYLEVLVREILVECRNQDRTGHPSTTYDVFRQQFFEIGDEIEAMAYEMAVRRVAAPILRETLISLCVTALRMIQSSDPPAWELHGVTKEEPINQNPLDPHHGIG